MMALLGGDEHARQANVPVEVRTAIVAAVVDRPIDYTRREPLVFRFG